MEKMIIRKLIKLGKKLLFIPIFILIGYFWIDDRRSIENNANEQIEELQYKLSDCINENDSLKNL